MQHAFTADTGDRTYCWNKEIQCSSNRRRGFPVPNSGLGRLRRRSIRAAVDGYPQRRALRDEREEYVEIFWNLHTRKEFKNNSDCNIDPQDLTIGKTLYFTHEGKSPRAGPGEGVRGFVEKLGGVSRIKARGDGEHKLGRFHNRIPRLRP